MVAGIAGNHLFYDSLFYGIGVMHYQFGLDLWFDVNFSDDHLCDIVNMRLVKQVIHERHESIYAAGETEYSKFMIVESKIRDFIKDVENYYSLPAI